MRWILAVLLLAIAFAGCTIYWDSQSGWGVEWSENEPDVNPTLTPTPDIFDNLWGR